MTELSCVSVVVPVYNVKQYLSDCVESICGQTYSNLQILLVDDGSTDGSSQLCEALAKRDSRICLISQENRGVSAARNIGLSQATGDYICFVDADDLLENNAIETMLKNINGQQLLLSRYSMFDDTGVSDEGCPDYSLCELDCNTMMDALLIPTKKYGYQGYLWNKLFVHRIIQENNLRFAEGIAYNEDRLFISQYLLHVDTTLVIPNRTYQYRLRADSVMSVAKIGFSMKQLTELDAFHLIENELQKLHHPLYKKAVMATMRGTSNLFMTVPRTKEYQSLRKELKTAIRKRIRIVCLGRDEYISWDNRFRCLYYYVRTMWR